MIHIYLEVSNYKYPIWIILADAINNLVYLYVANKA